MNRLAYLAGFLAAVYAWGALALVVSIFACAYYSLPFVLFWLFLP